MTSDQAGGRGRFAVSSDHSIVMALGRRAVRTAVLSGLLAALLAGAVQAQLSDDDIARLRKQGEEEGWTFTISANEATKYPLSQLCGAVPPPDWREHGRWEPCTPLRSLPSTFDWRPLGGCTPVRNQGGCGSCWAFGAMGTVESYLLIQYGVSLDLSEQWLVSCTSAGDCGGGWHSTSYEYLKCNGLTDPCGGTGAVLESVFPYTATNAPCHCPYPHPYCIPGWAFVGPQWDVASVAAMKQAIIDHGPISVCVYAGGAFQGYSGGVFNACENQEINHVVDLVGWDDNQGTAGVWFMRNSWGSGWGEGGYMRIEYGCSLIGYAAAFVNYMAESGSTTLPFSDTFPSTTLDASKWTGIKGAEVNDLGINEPSEPYSMNLDGSSTGGDQARTAIINTSYLLDINISYKWERRGGGDSPETGDDLIVEYVNSNYQWVELARYPGSGADMTTYTTASFTLTPADHADAFHPLFRLQFRVTSSQAGLDDYFVDDLSITTTTDTQPPSGLTWVQQPIATGVTSVTMSAQAVDPSGVQYYFSATGIGGHSSGWQAGQTFTDNNLEVNRNYSFKVKARDLALPIHNETAYLPPVALATFIETPTGLSFGSISNTAIQVTALDTFTRLTDNESGLYFEVTDQDGAPVGGGQANAWVQPDSPPQTITATGLTPGTTYRFRVKARNYFGVNETAWYPAVGYVEQTTTGGAPCTLLGDVNNDGTVNGLDIGGFVHAKLGGGFRPGEKQACANYGGTLQEDIAAFVADLLGL